jgi:hypothetical protein
MTISSFFQYYIFHSNRAPSKQSEILSLITSVALGILTLGLIHIFCFAVLYNRKIAQVINKTEEDKKTTEVFQNTVDKGAREQDIKADESVPKEEVSFAEKRAAAVIPEDPKLKETLEAFSSEDRDLTEDASKIEDISTTEDEEDYVELKNVKWVDEKDKKLLLLNPPSKMSALGGVKIASDAANKVVDTAKNVIKEESENPSKSKKLKKRTFPRWSSQISHKEKKKEEFISEKSDVPDKKKSFLKTFSVKNLPRASAEKSKTKEAEDAKETVEKRKNTKRFFLLRDLGTRLKHKSKDSAEKNENKVVTKNTEDLEKKK